LQQGDRDEDVGVSPPSTVRTASIAFALSLCCSFCSAGDNAARVIILCQQPIIAIVLVVLIVIPIVLDLLVQSTACVDS
jgi:hypothetical protein